MAKRGARKNRNKGRKSRAKKVKAKEKKAKKVKKIKAKSTAIKFELKHLKEKKAKPEVEIHKPFKRSAYFYVGLVFSILALILLVANAAVGLGMKEKILLELQKTNNVDLETINSVIISLVSAWLLLSLLLILSIVSILRDSRGWYYFLIIGLLAILALRIETAILILISSFLFWIEKNRRYK